MTTAAPVLARPGRWRVLAAFVLTALVTQMLWLNFAPLLVEVERDYAVDAGTAALLILVFPLLYCALSVHSGRLIDRLGYRKVVGVGTLVGALGSLVRLDTDHFAALLGGQAIIACAQPYVVNGINKLVADWFTGEEAAMATGLGTVGMFLGMALGLAATPWLHAELGWRGAMAVTSGVALLAVLVWYALAAETGAAPTGQPSRFAELLHNRGLVVLVGLGALGLGFFNGLTTWLEQLVAPRGLDAAAAGLLGGTIILGGIVGAVVVPPIADRLQRRRRPLLLCTIGAGAAYAGLAAADSRTALLVAGGLLGLAFMPAFALLLAMTGEVVAPRDGGAATSLVMLAGNAGGVLVIVVMALLGDWAGATPWLVMGATVAATIVLAFAAPETLPRGPQAHRPARATNPG